MIQHRSIQGWFPNSESTITPQLNSSWTFPDGQTIVHGSAWAAWRFPVQWRYVYFQNVRLCQAQGNGLSDTLPVGLPFQTDVLWHLTSGICMFYYNELITGEDFHVEEMLSSPLSLKRFVIFLATDSFITYNFELLFEFMSFPQQKLSFRGVFLRMQIDRSPGSI